MKKSDGIALLAQALTKAQGMLKGAKKDADNPFFKSKYADLESVWEAARPALSANELSVVQTIGYDEHGPNLTTMLLHSSGEWISDTQPILTKDASPQALGSGASYARRYGLAAIVGIVQVDDDAELAMSRKPEQPKTYKPPVVDKPTPFDNVPPPGLNMAKEFPNDSFPIESDPTAPFAEYQIEAFKDLIGKTLKEVDMKELRRQRDGIIAWGIKNDKPINKWKSDIEAIETYLGIRVK